MKVKTLLSILEHYNPESEMVFTGAVHYPNQLNPEELNTVDLCLLSVYIDQDQKDNVFIDLQEVDPEEEEEESKE